jgi:putative zinc finger protein
MSCEQTRGLAAELALGIADGAERAQVLDHLAGCAECRRAVAELSEVTDELLLDAPEHEPPVGFESRVLARLQPAPAPQPRRRRLRRALYTLAPAAVTAAIATVVVLGATGDDRRLADEYRAALGAAHGSEFEAARLHAPGNVSAGVVYAYRGHPSWIFVYLDGAHRSDDYRVELAMTSGRRMPLPGLRIDPSTGSGGQVVRIDPRDVASVRLVGAEPGDVLEADLPQSEGWED